MAASNEFDNSRERLSDKSFNRVLMEIVGPVLIMLMVGALVFFLIEIFYRGPHTFRLRWVFGLFTAASVLVSRISIEEGLERAALFGFALAAATLLVAVSLVDFEYGAFIVLEPVVVTLFIAVVMWSANRLTWDCTVIDGSRDVSSIGLVELVKRKISKRGSREKTTALTVADETSPPVDTRKRARSWWFMLFANSNNQNTPGLWVFYFAMAAFPIFGFGQWFAQPGPNWGYRWIFLLFAIYLGSALGLLMLTSLLGLERYLKKRGAALPASVSRSWMAVGSVFALAVMLIMLLLPAPNLSTSWQDALAFLTSRDKNASRHAVGKDGKEEGENPQNQKVDQDAKDAEQKPGEKGEGQGDQGKGGDSKSPSRGSDASGDAKSKPQSDGKSRSNSKDAQKGDQSQQDKDSSDQKQDETQQDDNKRSNNREAKSGDEQNDSNAEGKQNEQGKDQQQDANKDQQNEKRADNRQQQNDAKQPAKQRAGQRNAKPPPQQSGSRSPAGVSRFLGRAMRFLVYGVGLIILVVVIWMFRDELAKLWSELFGKKDRTHEEDRPAIGRRDLEKPLPDFAQFRDPFATGLVAKWPPSKTIQHTFDALEAWARGHEQPRDHDQTPHEFAAQLEQLDKNVGNEARLLADLFGQSLYGDGGVEMSRAASLQRLWRLMNSNAPRKREMQLTSKS